MRRVFLLPLAAVVSLGIGSCRHQAPTVTVVQPSAVSVTPADDRAYFDLNYGDDFQICLELPRNGQRVCQDLARLRAEFACIQRVQP